MACGTGVVARAAEADLPYKDGSFDVALCQSALFFFTDPLAAVREMARVVATGGRVALQTYAGLEEQPGYGPFVEAVVRHAGPQARALLGTYWSVAASKTPPYGLYVY